MDKSLAEHYEYSIFKDQILAGEKLSTIAKDYSRLQSASLTHGSTSSSRESSALVSSDSNCGGFCSGRGVRHGGGQRSPKGGDARDAGGSSHGGCGGRSGHGNHSEWKCSYCGGRGHTELCYYFST
ncbi:hypothetical protein F0562_014028 [Nyssa sinensis]|uniref:Uncharacterized protein n=1 Tax=Nyssa sinensis TaxID=561372 RepID=A0A5J4ZQQ5_9ASTE|nr:hypothetical protein F0562_014028 [Nyssa sinensis]